MKNGHPFALRITEMTPRSFLSRSALGAAGVALSRAPLSAVARPLFASE